MDKDDFTAAKCTFQTIDMDDVLEFRAWCLLYADLLIAALEVAQAECERLQARLDKIKKDSDDWALIIAEPYG